MTFLSLEYFLAIASEGSISAAARRLFISQQSLSEQVKKLEKHFGVPLLQRTSPVTLTPAGEKLVAAAKEILRIRDTLEDQIADLRREGEVTLTLGLMYRDSPPFLPEIINQIQAEQEGGNLHINVQYIKSFEELASGEIDLFIGVPPFPEEMGYLLLLSDYLCIVVSRELLKKTFGPQAEKAEKALAGGNTRTVLEKLPFVRHSVPNTPGQLTDSDQGIPFLKEKMTTDSGDLIKELCIAGRYAVIMPHDYAVRTFRDQEQILIYPINSSKSRWEFGIAYPKNRALSSAAGSFIRLVQQSFAGAGEYPR